MSAEALSHLKIAQLRLIAAIAESGQLQVAARDLSMTQPAASRMLAEIERMAGAALFERHAKGLRPTPVGRVLARRAGQMVRDLRALAEEVGDALRGRSGQVRVGAVTGPAVGYLVPAIQELKAASPGAEVTVDVAPSTALVRGLVAGQYDFVLARPMPEYDRRDFEILPARNEVVSLLVRSDHPLSRAPMLSLRELAPYEWVIQERGAPIRQAVEDAFSAVRHPGPKNIINTSSLLLMIAILSQTNAIASMSEEVAALLTEPPVSAGLTRLRLKETLTVSPYFLITARGRGLPPIANRLRELVLGELARRGVSPA